LKKQSDNRFSDAHSIHLAIELIGLILFSGNRQHQFKNASTGISPSSELHNKGVKL
jgi:hypothetical protein